MTPGTTVLLTPEELRRPWKELARAHRVTWSTIRDARKAAGIVVRQGGAGRPRPSRRALDRPKAAPAMARLAGVDLTQPIRVIASACGVSQTTVSSARKAAGINLRREKPHPEPIVAPPAPVRVEAPAKVARPTPPARVVYDGEGDRIVPGTRVRVEAVLAAWKDCRNGRKPREAVAARLGISVEQVRAVVESASHS